MIARKPKAKGKQAVDVERLIRKGGSPASSQASGGKTVAVLLKLPDHTLAVIDELVKARRVPTRRMTWLLEAILEKIERES